MVAGFAITLVVVGQRFVWQVVGHFNSFVILDVITARARRLGPYFLEGGLVFSEELASRKAVDLFDLRIVALLFEL